MFRTILALSILCLTAASQSIAASDFQPPAGVTPPLEDKRARTIKTIDERIEILKLRKECVLASKSNEEMDECKKKFHLEEKKGKE